MVRDELSVMSAFLAVADEKSFTKAAKRLGVTQSALSHAIRGLEEQLGVRLLARTTRNVAPTEAGEQLLAELRPALTGIRGALEKIGGLRNTPRGRLRLQVPRLAAMHVLGPKLAQFARDYPDVVLDVSTDETRLDLVAAGFDAGVQYGEFIQRDMIAVRVSPDHRPAIVASPGYFDEHPKPSSPHDLLQHRCVNYRHGSGEVYRWEFDKGDQSVAVAVNGPLITNDIGLLTAPRSMASGSPSCRTSRRDPTSRAGRWCGCWKTGVHRFPGSSSTTRAASSSPRHLRRSSTH
jgi:DNA-binding transcriptional LysR family regulator